MAVPVFALLTACGPMGTGTSGSNGSVLGEVLGAMTDGQTLGNILKSVIGLDKPTQQQLVGAWKYRQPGVAFTSDNLLAKAGGEVAATKAKEKLQTYYQSLGISSANTQITIGADNNFSAKIAGKSFSGTYAYDASQCKLTLSTMLFTIPCYVKGTTVGMSYLFESKKLLTLLQTLAALSGNKDLNTLGDLSKNYDGIRMGFDMSK